MSVKATDKSRVPELLKALKELSEKHIEIGVFGEDDSKLLMIARVNEFGVDIKVTPKMRAYLHAQGLHLKNDTTHIHIPERSFMRGGFDDNLKKMQKTAQKLLDKVIKGEIDTKTFFSVLGENIVGMIQKHLTDLKRPPKHSFTLSKDPQKHNPLIQDGRLRSAITWKVV